MSFEEVPCTFKNKNVSMNKLKERLCILYYCAKMLKCKKMINDKWPPLFWCRTLKHLQFFILWTILIEDPESSKPNYLNCDSMLCDD